MVRQINAAGLDLIKSFEGLRLDAYRDSVGVLTIGYGHTSGVKAGDRITEAKATQFLLADLADAESAVEKYISVPLNDNQFAALVSFTFNLGAERLRRSTLRKKLNAGDYKPVPNQLALWANAGGKKLPGLVRRRKAEADLWDMPSIASVQPAQKPPVDADKTAGIPIQPKTPEAAPAPGSGRKMAAAGALVAIGATLAAWGHHIIAWIEGAFSWLW